MKVCLFNYFYLSKTSLYLARKVEIADFFAASSPPHSSFLATPVS